MTQAFLVVTSPTHIKSWATQSACSNPARVLLTVLAYVNGILYTTAVSSPAKTRSTWDIKAYTASEGSLYTRRPVNRS